MPQGSPQYDKSHIYSCREAAQTREGHEFRSFRKIPLNTIRVISTRAVKSPKTREGHEFHSCRKQFKITAASAAGGKPPEARDFFARLPTLLS